MGQHVEDVAAFIGALKGGKVHLVGNSGGGVVAAHVALKYPDLLRSVVLGEPALVPPVSAEGKAALAADQKDRQKVQAALNAGDLRQATILTYDLAVIGEPGAFEKLSVEQQQRRLDNAKTLGMRARAGPLPVTCDQLGSLSVPTLVWRKHSRDPPPLQRRAAELLAQDDDKRGHSRWPPQLAPGKP